MPENDRRPECAAGNRSPCVHVARARQRIQRRTRKSLMSCGELFLCDFVAGSTADHDHEVDDARWIPLADAPKVLSYTGERALIAGALSKLASGR